MDLISSDLISEWVRDHKAVAYLLRLRKARCDETLEVMTKGLEREMPRHEHGAIARGFSLREYELMTGKQIRIPGDNGNGA